MNFLNVFSRRLDVCLIFFLTTLFGVAGCSKEGELPPAAPTVAYVSLIATDDAVGNTFVKRPLDSGSGNALDFISRTGVMNILDYVVEEPDLTGYVKIEKAYSFGEKYLLLVSTGEAGNSCPATTYAIAFDSQKETVTGQQKIDGCSENLESFSEGNKLTVKKDGAASVFFNAEVKQAARSPKIAAAKSPDAPQSAPNKKMLGDMEDTNPNAKPRSAAELKNKKNKKEWQDSNGYIHYPDGSISAGPVD